MLGLLYTKLFNAVLDSGYIPRSWLEGGIIPVFKKKKKKKGSPKEPCNYRPITILSCLGKLFTSVLNQRLTSYLEDNSVLHENQAGFRRDYSTSNHLLTLHVIIDILRKRKQIYCAFIDFSQAFNKVWSVGVWHKLLQNSICGKYTVIYNMYQKIKSMISHNGAFSEAFSSEIGVRQGENKSQPFFQFS